MGPSDSCWTRLPIGGVATVALAAQTGLPCCKSPRVRTCCAHYPGEQDDLHMSVHQVVLGGLRPSVRRLGARIEPFEACSGFTRVAARTLADPP